MQMCETYTSYMQLLVFCLDGMWLFLQIIFCIPSNFKARQTFLHALWFFMIFRSSDPLLLPSLCISVLQMKYDTSEFDEMETQ